MRRVNTTPRQVIPAKGGLVPANQGMIGKKLVNNVLTKHNAKGTSKFPSNQQQAFSERLLWRYIVVFLVVCLPFVASASEDERQHQGVFSGAAGYVFDDNHRAEAIGEHNRFVGELAFKRHNYKASLLNICFTADRECDSEFGLGLDYLFGLDKLSERVKPWISIGVGLGLSEVTDNLKFSVSPYLRSELGFSTSINRHWAINASVNVMLTHDENKPEGDPFYLDSFVLLGLEYRW